MYQIHPPTIDTLVTGMPSTRSPGTRPKKTSWATNYDDGDGDNDDDVVRVSNPETSGLGNLTKNRESDENEEMSDPPIKELHNHKANKSTST